MRSSFLAIYAGYGRVMGWFALLAGFLLFALMWLICANVLSRKLFNAPVVGTLELTEAAMPFVILLGMAFTQLRDGHIRVTLLTNRLPAPVERPFRVLMLIVGGLFFAWVAVATSQFALAAFSVGETAWGTIRIPIWPSKAVVAIGAIMLSIQFFLDAALLGIVRPQGDELRSLDRARRTGEFGHG